MLPREGGSFECWVISVELKNKKVKMLMKMGENVNG